MFKRLIAYQKLMLNSTPPFQPTQNLAKGLVGSIATVASIWLLVFIMGGDIMIAMLPFISVWMVYRIINSDRKLYELVPVTPLYTVINAYLLSFMILVLTYVFMIVLSFGIITMIMGTILLAGGTIEQGAPEGLSHVTGGGDIKSFLFMLMIFLIILFIGTTISFIKNKKLRITSLFTVGAMLYGFLYAVKISLPIAPGRSKVDFIESFNIAPHGASILMGLGIFTLITIPLSVVIGYKIYSSKENNIITVPN
jgi:hypothetical protein